MTLPFDNDTSRIVKKLAKRSLAAEKRRNLLICCTIAFAVALMTGLSFFAAAQKAKVERDIRGQYQVMSGSTAWPHSRKWSAGACQVLSRSPVIRTAYSAYSMQTPTGWLWGISPQLRGKCHKVSMRFWWKVLF